MSNVLDQIKEQFKHGDNLNKLIYINVGVFILVELIDIIFFIATGNREMVNWFVREWFALPSEPIKFLTRPWTLITYIFLHAGFWHLFWNMIILYFSGKIFLEYLGERRLLTVFMYGGIAGGMLFFIIYNLSPAFSVGNPLVGASAGVVAVMVAAAVYAPNLPVRLFFLLEVRFWMVAAFTVIFYFFAIKGNNAGGHLAHLGGAALGYIFTLQLRKGNDWSEGFYKLFETIQGWFKPKSPLKKVYTNTRGDTRSPRKKEAQNDQQRMDEILDKISKSGYEKLTKAEKEFLFKFGKK